jgi:hypothetical protein
MHNSTHVFSHLVKGVGSYDGLSVAIGGSEVSQPQAHSHALHARVLSEIKGIKYNKSSKLQLLTSWL